jgi:peptide/nickel transport system substrate-binding protein
MHIMHTFLSFIKNLRILNKQKLSAALDTLSKKQFLIFTGSLFVAAATLVIMLANVNNMFMVEIPANGGSITEGIIGMPTLVNPVIAVSDADKDLTSIVYSGLMRKTENGALIPDLAESYTISPDGTHYTFVIKKNAVFHDNTPVTSDDVVFTISKIKDPLIKSSRKVNWDGITVEKIDARTVVFTLKQPYISFMDNTTVGILPMHIWKNVTPAEFGLSILNNTKAIGSGPFQIDSVSKNSDGVPDTYVLKRFKYFTLGAPHIAKLTIVSFANEKEIVNALMDNSIDQAGGLSPENAATVEHAKYTINTATLPRLFGLFFNNVNNPILSDAQVLKALDTAIDRQGVVDEVLHGYGTPIHSPIPETILPKDTDTTYIRGDIEKAKSILDKAGWVVGTDGIRTKGNTTTITQTKKVGKKTVTTKVQVPTKDPKKVLAFTITTGDTPELRHTANVLQAQLLALGVRVDIKAYGIGELNSLIRSRNYQALFFGQVVNHESDIYSFWHSSERADPGLNIALYNNSKVDALLELNKKTFNHDARTVLYKNIVSQFNNDTPALLIYSPRYIYATSKNVDHIYLDTVTIPSDRFVSLFTWYADTDHVWKIFTK